MTESYARAGVDQDAAARIKKAIARQARLTHRPEVLSGVGFFGGLFEFKGYKNPLLVSSVDQVGTKTKIAMALNKYDTVGIDIVNHCVNDIFTTGAEPLFFLDYIGSSKLAPERITAIVDGLVRASKEVGCALIGGETGEMPGLYATLDDFDLVGFIIGVVEKEKLLMGKDITVGDVIVGFPSNGLHTNGYSLARKIFGETREKLGVFYPELDRTLGEALLEPHRCYYNLLKPFLPDIKGLAHITGSGLIGNVPRILPDKLTAELHSETWSLPAIFKLLRQKAKITPAEMYRVFNMGIGMAAICSSDNARKITAKFKEARLIGEVIDRTGDARVIIDNIGYHHDKIA